MSKARLQELREALSQVLTVARHYIPTDDLTGPSPEHAALHAL